ncbi:hypothetical protein SH661x_001381 [Planctomicrobium sp. SH661]|uniref:hypothetical protein n=1 Tax=Planctomicrobium sp. SH661 TaxID=3448124 RepID=UPI003F5BB3E8
MATVGGLLLLTLASTLGDEAVRTVILGGLTIVFVLSGGMLGLVTMHHVSHTHLPESADEELTTRSLGSAGTPIPPRQRARGFLGMFALSQDASSGEEPTDFRRTA